MQTPKIACEAHFSFFVLWQIDTYTVSEIEKVIIRGLLVWVIQLNNVENCYEFHFVVNFREKISREKSFLHFYRQRTFLERTIRMSF